MDMTTAANTTHLEIPVLLREGSTVLCLRRPRSENRCLPSSRFDPSTWLELDWTTCQCLFESSLSCLSCFSGWVVWVIESFEWLSWLIYLLPKFSSSRFTSIGEWRWLLALPVERSSGPRDWFEWLQSKETTDYSGISSNGGEWQRSWTVRWWGIKLRWDL